MITTACASARVLRDDAVAGRCSTASTVESAIARSRAIGAGPDGLNIFAWTDDNDARRHASSAAEGLSDTTPGLLLGVPVAIKDNIATTTLPTTCGSRILDGYVSPY